MLMFVLVVGSVFIVLVIPLAAWALVALSRWPGLIVGAALLGCAAGWLGLMAGWVPPGLVADLILALIVVTPALVMAGRLADRVAVVRRAPAADVQLRLVTAQWLPAGVVCLNVGVLLGLAVAVLYLNLNLQYTPPDSDVLPLPAAVTVVSDRDRGCPGGPGGPFDHCEREIDVTSAARGSLEQAAQDVTTGLTRMHGWRLSPVPGSSTSGGCRHEGWFLGREDVCVQVQYGQGTVRVFLDSDS